MAKRNYGPRGCALTLALLAAVVVILLLVHRWIQASGPTDSQIRDQTRTLIEQEWRDGEVDGVKIVEIYAQSKRFQLWPSRWAVRGLVRYRPEPNQLVDETFLAAVATVCNTYGDADCWSLDRLVVGGAQ